MNKTFRDYCCNKANHPWKEIARDSWDGDGLDRVIRWCKNCGCYVIDFEYDYRITQKGRIQTTAMARLESKRVSK